MITDLHEAHFPQTYERFVGLFQDKPWLKCTEKLQFQIKDNRLSERGIYQGYRVAYGLTLFDREHMSLRSSLAWNDVQHAMSFAAQVIYLIDQAKNEAGKKAYLARIRGAFANPEDMRAIRFEHLTALTMHTHGGQIEWPEESTGSETFDMLVSLHGMQPFEVECKSCSPDKGRPIKAKDAEAFLERMRCRLAEKGITGGLTAHKIRILKGLPSSHRALDQMVQEILDALAVGSPETETGILLTLNQKPITALNQTARISDDQLNLITDEAMGPTMGYRALHFDRKRGALLCIEVHSEQSAAVFNAMWKTAKHAVREQMTRERPGCLVIRLEGFSKEQLEQLASEKLNPLAWFATKVLTDDKHQHLACLAYISDERVVSMTSTSESAQSATYVFDNQVGHYSHLRLGALFTAFYKT